MRRGATPGWQKGGGRTAWELAIGGRILRRNPVVPVRNLNVTLRNGHVRGRNPDNSTRNARVRFRNPRERAWNPWTLSRNLRG